MKQCFPLNSHSLRYLCSLRSLVSRVLLVLCLSVTARYSQAVVRSDSEDITELSLEELHAISISAASKRSEPLFETPAAVSVLLPVDIDRAGVGSVAEALRLVPGVHVINPLPGQWNVGIRGGNGIQSTKLLVLVDGRSVYEPFYGSVDWSNAAIDLDDFARIEVVRGPGATLWGANAVNGIINVISKDARDTQGGMISIRAGSAEPAMAHFRYGGKLGGETWYRLSFSTQSTDGALGSLADDPAGGYKENRFGLRTDSYLNDRFQFTAQADVLDGKRDLDGNKTSHRVSSLLTRLKGSGIAGGELQVQLYYDVTRDRPGVSDNGGKNNIPLALNGDTKNLDIDVTHHVHLGPRNDFLWGGGARFTDDTIVSTQYLHVADPRLRSWLFNYFMQDEIALAPEGLRLTVGSKLEHHETIGWQLLPNLRLAWLPNARNTLWTAVSRAARAPSRGEREVLLTLAQIPATPFTPPVRVEVAGSPIFGAEINNAYEVGWRWRPISRFQTDATVYYFDYQHVRTLVSTTGFDFGPPPSVVQHYTLTNDASASTKGAEFSWTWRPSDRWELAGAVSRGIAHTEGVSANPLVASDYIIPSWLWHVRSWWQLPHDWEFSATLFGVGKNDAANAPSYLRLDSQLLWRPRPDLELSIGIQNATDPHHNEGITGDLLPNIDVRRNVYGRVQWRF